MTRTQVMNAARTPTPERLDERLPVTTARHPHSSHRLGHVTAPSGAVTALSSIRSTLSVRAIGWFRLLAGLWLFAGGIALMVRARLGVSSWDVLHDAVRLHTPLSFGAAVIAISVLVLSASYFLGVRPGPGTIANVVLVGAFVDALLFTGALADLGSAGLPARLSGLVVGVIALAFGTALYISAGLGAGPRDSLMIAAANRLGISTGAARALIEGTVLVVGALLGGALGVGTAVFAVLIGPAINGAFRVFGMEPPRDKARPSVLVRGSRSIRAWGRRGQVGPGSWTDQSNYAGQPRR